MTTDPFLSLTTNSALCPRQSERDHRLAGRRVRTPPRHLREGRSRLQRHDAYPGDLRLSRLGQGGSGVGGLHQAGAQHHRGGDMTPATLRKIAAGMGGPRKLAQALGVGKDYIYRRISGKLPIG